MKSIRKPILGLSPIFYYLSQVSVCISRSLAYAYAYENDASQDTPKDVHAKAEYFATKLLSCPLLTSSRQPQWSSSRNPIEVQHSNLKLLISMLNCHCCSEAFLQKLTLISGC